MRVCGQMEFAYEISGAVRDDSSGFVQVLSLGGQGYH